MLAHPYNASPWEAEAGGLVRKLKASLRYIVSSRLPMTAIARLCLKETTTKEYISKDFYLKVLAALCKMVQG